MPKRTPVSGKHSNLQIGLGVVIRQYRRALGLTQEELAWRANMHRTYIADLERGSRNVTLRVIANLAGALGVTLGKLFAFASAPAVVAASRPKISSTPVKRARRS